MLLSGQQIIEKARCGSISIDPFDPRQAGPNSYDVTLGDTVARYRHMPLDTRTDNPVDYRYIPPDGLCLDPGVLYLGNTVERIGSRVYAPMLEGRSSIARLGVFVHVAAGFGDVGFVAQWTLEIIATHPTIIYPGMKIAQVYFEEVAGDPQLYGERPGSKYADQRGPTPSLIHQDEAKG